MNKSPSPAATAFSLRVAEQQSTAGHAVSPGFEPAPAPRRSGYIPHVDALRAIAAIAVIAFHAGLLPFGWAGVWLFYVISGFVIARGMVARDWRLSGASYGRFFVARMRRIWPLYFLYAGLLGLVSSLFFSRFPTVLSGIPPAGEVFSLVTFTNNFYQMFDLPTTRALDHLWTISVEQQFYLIFPVLFVAARSRPVLVLGGVIVAATLIRVATVTGLLGAGVSPEETVHALYFFSLGHFDAFAVGVLMAFGLDWITVPARRHALYAVAILASALFLAFALSRPDSLAAIHAHSVGALGQALRTYLGSRPTDPVAMVVIYTVISLLSAALLTAAISPTSRIRRPLAWRPLVWVGQISYGVYVWHRIVVNIAESIIGAPDTHPAMALRLIGLALTIAVTIVLAALSYRLFEVRFHKRIGT